MAILRDRSQRGYTVVDNYALRDGRLSLKALGLLVKMLSLPDCWEFSEAGLVAIVKDGQSSVRSALKELEGFGYLVRTMERDGNGRMTGCDWEVFAVPCENPHLENRNLENRNLEIADNKALKETTTNEPTTKKSDNARPRFAKPTLGEVEAYCLERGNGIDPQRFIDHYDANGWKVGRNQMKDWKAAIRTWERNGFDSPRATRSKDDDIKERAKKYADYNV